METPRRALRPSRHPLSVQGSGIFLCRGHGARRARRDAREWLDDAQQPTLFCSQSHAKACERCPWPPKQPQRSCSPPRGSLRAWTELDPQPLCGCGGPGPLQPHDNISGPGHSLVLSRERESTALLTKNAARKPQRGGRTQIAPTHMHTKGALHDRSAPDISALIPRTAAKARWRKSSRPSSGHQCWHTRLPDVPDPHLWGRLRQRPRPA